MPTEGSGEEKADRIYIHITYTTSFYLSYKVVAQQSGKGFNFQHHCLVSLFLISNKQSKEMNAYTIFF